MFSTTRRLLRPAAAAAVKEAAAPSSSVPKVELHRHLEGAVRLQTVLDLAVAHDVPLPHGARGEITPAPRLTLDGIRPHIQTLAPFPDLATLLGIFDRTQSTFGDLDAFRRIAREAVADAHGEGVRLLELRYAPSFASIGNNFPFAAVLEAVREGVAEGQGDVGGADEIGVGLLCIGVGAMGPEEMGKTTDFFLANRDAFVGFDMAGAETDVLGHADCFARVRAAGGRITCHASEDLEVGVPSNALNAIQELGAHRIGHGIQIVHDQRVMDAVRDAGTLLEVSVTSNWLTNGVPSVAAHPARRLWEHGIPVCVNTDDPGIMSIDLNGEWDIWRDTLGFSAAEMTAMTVLAMEASFVDAAEKERLFGKHFAAHVGEAMAASDEAGGPAAGDVDLARAVEWARGVHRAATRQEHA